MTVLGIDPGIKNTGWCVMRNGRVGRHGVIVPPGNKKLPLEFCLQYILTELDPIIIREEIAVAAVEHVVWQGRRRRITMPLSHIAGAIIGYCLARGLVVHALTPAMKDKKVFELPTEHEKDAANLARVATR